MVTQKHLSLFSSGKQSCRGLSVVEMLMVLLIVVILGTTSYFYYARFQDRDVLEADAMRIQKMLGTARTQAIRDGEMCQVGFNTEEETFWLERQNIAGEREAIIPPAPMNDYVNLHEVEVIDTGSIPTTGTLPLNTEYIRFFADGSSQEARIYLVRKETGNPATAADEDFYTIKLYGPTGKPRIFEKERR